MNRKAMLDKVELTIIGPAVDALDFNHRELSIEMEFQWNESLSSEYSRYEFQAWTGMSSDGKWCEPYSGGPYAGVVGRSITLTEATKIVKNLTTFQKYLDKLVIKPRTFVEYIQALLSMYKVGRLTLIIAPDRHTRLQYEYDIAPVHVLHIISQKYEQLMMSEVEVPVR